MRKLLYWDLFWWLRCVALLFCGVYLSEYSNELGDDTTMCHTGDGTTTWFIEGNSTSSTPTELLFTSKDDIVTLLNHWQFKDTFYWIQVIYSFTTFPFICWMIPILKNFVSHAHPTGYTKYGQCVARVPPPPRTRDRNKGSSSARGQGQSKTADDAANMA